MSNSKPSTNNRKFWLFAGSIVLVASATLAALWPVALSLARSESQKLSEEGSRVGGAEGEMDYHLAYRLDQTNSAAALHFGTAQLASDQPQAALDSVSRAGKGSEVEQLRVKALLELGRTNDAMAAADQLTTSKPSDSSIEIAALAYGVGERGSALRALEARVSSPEALGHVQRAEGGNLPLAANLYATGLLRSSSALLVKLPSSALRSLYLGRINFRWHTKDTLATAADYYASAISQDPSDQTVRTEYIVVLTDLGRTDEATRQRQLLAKLVSGTP